MANAAVEAYLERVIFQNFCYQNIPMAIINTNLPGLIMQLKAGSRT